MFNSASRVKMFNYLLLTCIDIKPCSLHICNFTYHVQTHHCYYGACPNPLRQLLKDMGPSKQKKKKPTKTKTPKAEASSSKAPSKGKPAKKPKGIRKAKGAKKTHPAPDAESQPSKGSKRPKK